jgi:hypothetical protein
MSENNEPSRHPHPISIALLTSALIGKPLLCRFFVSSTGSARPVGGVLDQLSGDPASHQKITWAAAIFG